MAKKKFRVGVAARTVDGREIKREYIEKAAKLYNPDVYGARINLEHIRSVTADSPFKALGDVLSVEFKMEKVGDKERPVMYAELDPTDDLVAMNKSGQKVFTSMELQPDFPEPGDWYLVGLAVTDSPASMGTQRLSFSAAETSANLIGEYSEAEMLSEEETKTPGFIEKFTSRIDEIFSGLKKSTDNKTGDLEAALELFATEFEKFASALPADPTETINELKSQLASMQEQFTAQAADLKELSEAMESVELHQRRPAATGGDGEQKADF